MIVLVLGAGAQKLQLLGLISRITPGRVSSNQPPRRVPRLTSHNVGYRTDTPADTAMATSEKP
ncbi:Uncharacterised protein [Mycobacteroides abscessus subsp. bolletii]|nr:Uncharacterised protein [Mycobacteroides abscessus subsp. bolletii]SHS03793.1 Uncharacterised protein [Mycobacteroides abscessus subsp. bolletii]SHS98881.1 Uncharacterised protein [Mycobacteroides abscessus subsp. bolletii]SKF67301.1 Uncharacterised protein [Mycobacteroides abscessus subsp. bolletii]SKG17375.1 Uncharacterised protein [Mycobacteroides abscessus subsp. bolletii]